MVTQQPPSDSTNPSTTKPIDVVELGQRTLDDLGRSLAGVGMAVAKDTEADDARVYSTKGVVVRTACQVFAGCYTALVPQNPNAADPRVIVAATELFVRELVASGYVTQSA
jgi:hypothetical protein